MTEEDAPLGTVGVVVARFQTDNLTEGHKALLDLASTENHALLVVLGQVRGAPTERDPLDFRTRERMVLHSYPKARVAKLYDHPSDEAWSKSLDQLIHEEFPTCMARLYGGRDSFLSHYSGQYVTERFKGPDSDSGTDRRAITSFVVRSAEDFRAGVMYSNAQRYPVSYQTVDIAVMRENQVLLAGKRQDGGKFRFIGGFVSPKDKSLESAARRECYEETGGLAVDGFQYRGSCRIDDWRYRGSRDQIMTAFFQATYMYGKPVASDDIDFLEWVNQDRLSEMLVEEHKPLIRLLKMEEVKAIDD